MRTSAPIITCDSEDGCDQWTLDWYEAAASNWQELMAPGWQYDPYNWLDGQQLCPEHASEVTT